MVQHAVDNILQEYLKKLSAKSEYQEHDNIDREIDKKYLFEIDRLILDDNHKE